MDKEDKLMPLVVRTTKVTAGIPVINNQTRTRRRDTEKHRLHGRQPGSAYRGKKGTKSFEVPAMVSATVDITQKREKTPRCCMLEGSDPC